MTNEVNDSKWGYGLSNMPPSIESRNQTSEDQISDDQSGPESLGRLDSGRWTPGDFNVRTDTMQLGRIDIEQEAPPSSSRVDPDWRQQSAATFAPDPSSGDTSVSDSPRLPGNEDDVGEIEHLDDDLDRSDSARNMIEWAVVLVASVLIALLIRALFIQAFWIPSSSMETTLLVKDRVLVNKIGYRIGDVDRGDIVVFHKTDTEIESRPDDPKDVIKRVIGLPGEMVLIQNNQVIIDGKLLIEPYLDADVLTSDFGPDVVPDDHVFVMGDNRSQSADSRFDLGPVASDRIVGKAFFTFWPVSSMGGL